MNTKALFFAGATALSFVLAGSDAAAQSTERDKGWNDVTNALAVAAVASQAVMPRVFYSDPETTVGWKARWHVSVLAPVLAVGGLAFLNEQVMKDAIKGKRPGCQDTSTPECATYGAPSTQSFAAFASLGQGTAVFLVDTLKWSDGRVNVPSLIGNVGVPLTLSVITAVGRGAGNWEDAGQIVAGAGAGLAIGAIIGLGYAMLQRPECPYGAAALCW